MTLQNFGCASIFLQSVQKRNELNKNHTSQTNSEQSVSKSDDGHGERQERRGGVSRESGGRRSPGEGSTFTQLRGPPEEEKKVEGRQDEQPTYGLSRESTRDEDLLPDGLAVSLGGGWLGMARGEGPSWRKDRDKEGVPKAKSAAKGREGGPGQVAIAPAGSVKIQGRSRSLLHAPQNQ